MIESGEVQLAQKDGNQPTILAAGSAPGESGISVIHALFRESMHVSTTSRQHFVSFKMSPYTRVRARCAGRMFPLSDVPIGAVTVLPAGIDYHADADGDVDVLAIAIDRDQLALAAADDSAPQAEIVECFAGIHNPVLFDFVRTLALESARGYPEGALFWNDVASRLMHEVVVRHTSLLPSRSRGVLGREMLRRIREYVIAHLDEPVDVATLAAIAGRSQFHFSRVFTRSVGISPYRYVVHLRLQRAVELIRDGRLSLAEIAARTGFADQSHLSRWVRRVYGASPRWLVG
jgi:AraC family transcriptional regulator